MAALLFRLDAFDGLPDDAAVEQSSLGFGFRQLWHVVRYAVLQLAWRVLLRLVEWLSGVFQPSLPLRGI